MKKAVIAAIALAVAFSTGIDRASARPAAQTATELMQYLPNGTAVILVDVHKVTASSLWAALIPKSGFKKAVDDIEGEVSELGVKLTGAGSAAILFTTADFKKPLVAVSGGFSQDEVLGRLRANQKIKLISEKYKDFDVYSIAAAQPGTKVSDVSFVFYDAATAVAGSSSGVRASIDVRSGARAPISQNAKLAAALSANPEAAIRFAMELNAGVAGSLQSSQLPLPDFSSVSLIFGTVEVASGLALNATLRSDTPAHAKEIADRLNGVLDMGRSYLSAAGDPKLAVVASGLKTITIAGVDNDVKIAGSMPAEVLAQIFR